MDRNEAIDIVKKNLLYDRHQFSEALETLIPELKDNEDERIRKELLQIANESEDSFYMIMTPNKRKCLITWLEKQWRQKPVWSEEDEKKINYLIVLVQNHTLHNPVLRTANEELENWLKSLKDRCTWKPNDEQMEALHYVTNFDYGGHKTTLVSLYEQLKKLKD